MVKKNKTKSRYLVLYEDHFECYHMRDEFIRRAKPLCNVSLAAVRAVEVSQPCDITVKLFDRDFQFRTSDQGDAERWAMAWNDALSACASVPAGIRVRLVEARVAEEILGEDSDDDAEEASVHVPIQMKLCEGTLGVEKNGKKKVEHRHVVLFSDRLEYYADSFALSKGEEPRARVMLQDIAKMEMLLAGIKLHLSDRSLILHMNESDADTWRYNLSRVLDAGKSQTPRSATQQPQSAPSQADKQPAASERLNAVAKAKQRPRSKSRPRSVEPPRKPAEAEPTASPQKGRSMEKVSVTATSREDAKTANSDVSTAHTSSSSAARPAVERAESPVRARGSTPRRCRSPQGLSVPDTAIPCPAQSSTPRARSKSRERLATGSSIPQPPVRRVLEGTLQDESREPRHVVLYETRLEMYRNAADSLKQVKPLDCILLSDLLSFKVEDMGFELKLDEHTSRRLTVSEPYEFFEWMHAWEQVPVESIGSRLNAPGPVEDSSMVSEGASFLSEATSSSSLPSGASASMAAQLRRKAAAPKVTPRARTPRPTPPLRELSPKPTSARDRARSAGGSSAAVGSRPTTPTPTSRGTASTTPRQAGMARTRSAPRLDQGVASSSGLQRPSQRGRVGPPEAQSDLMKAGASRRHSSSATDLSASAQAASSSTTARRNSAPMGPQPTTGSQHGMRNDAAVAGFFQNLLESPNPCGMEERQNGNAARHRLSCTTPPPASRGRASTPTPTATRGDRWR